MAGAVLQKRGHPREWTGNASEDVLGAPDNGIPGSDLTTRAGSFAIHGRGERIRTSGPCLPKAVLYQAELHPDTWTDPGLDHTWELSESLNGPHVTPGLGAPHVA